MRNPARTFSFIILFFFSLQLANNQATDLQDEFSGMEPAERVEYKLKKAEEFSGSEIEKSISLAKTALSEALELKDDSLIARARLSIGKYYDYLGANAEAADYLTEAIEIFTQLNMYDERIQALKLIGNTYWYMGEFELALDYFNECIQYSAETGDTARLISGLNARGSVYGNLRIYDTARSLFVYSYNLAEKAKLENEKLQSLFYLGDVTLFSGDPRLALNIFNDIEEQFNFDTLESKFLPVFYHSKALAYFELGMIDKADYYAEKENRLLLEYPRYNQLERYYKLKYRIDTARKDFAGALNYLQLHKQLHDSLQSSNFRKQMANYKIVYQLQEKESRIEQLKLDNSIKDMQLKERRLIIIGTFLMIFILLSAGALLYILRLREKRRNYDLQKANHEILSQRKALSEKNDELQSVIEELQLTQQNLVHSEKMASLGTLVSGVAHEINNPLNYISGGVEIIGDFLKDASGKLSEETKNNFTEALQMISEGVDRTSSIVKSLNTFSYQGKPVLEAFKLGEIIDNTLVLLQPNLTDRITIRKNYHFTEPLLVFPDKLHQVILSILDNAIFEINNTKPKDPEIIITTRLQNEQVLIKVENTGSNIPEAVLSKIFDPFFTTKDPGKGTGLGLSTSYSLIREHQGAISVENTEIGCCFTIELPYRPG